MGEREEMERARQLTARGDKAFDAADFHLALECYERSSQIHTTLKPRSPELATDLENIGLVHRTLGKTELALSVYRRALDIRLETAPGSEACSRDYARLGAICYVAGDLKEALPCWEGALAIDEAREGDSITTAQDLRNLGLVRYGLGDLAQAQSDFDRALGIRVRVDPNSAETAASHSDVGLIQRARSDLDGALESFRRAFSIAQRLDPNSIRTATYLNNIASVHRQRGELDSALAFYEQVLAICAASDTLESSTLSNIGVVHEARGELDRALSYYQQALEIDELRRPRSLETSTDLTNIGSVHHTRGDLSLALSFYERALAIAEAVSPRAAETAVQLNNVAAVHRARGDLDLALSLYERVLTIRQTHAAGSMETASVLNNIGLVYAERGDLDLALCYYEQALKICERVAPKSIETATKLGNIASVYRARGALDLALAFAERALEIDRAVAPTSVATARLSNDIGELHAEQGDFDGALSHVKQALTIDESLARNSTRTATDLNNIGAIYLGRGDLDTALDYFQRALSIDERAVPDSVRTATDLGNIAYVRRLRGEFDSALKCYERALAIDEASAPGAVETATDLSNIGFVHRDLGDLDLALSFFERAAGVIESLTARAGDPTARQGVFAQHTHVYRGIVGVLSEREGPGDDALAFSYAERLRARALAELLARRVWRPRDRTDHELLETELRLRHAVADLGNRIAAAGRGDADEAMLSELRRDELTARRALSQVQARVDRVRVATELAAPAPVDLAAAQRVIDDQQLVLEYLYGIDHVFLFVVSKSSLRMVALGVTPSELDRLLEEALELFRRGGRSDADTPERLSRLRDVLLGPVSPELLRSASQVLVIPDGALHSLPFETLPEVAGEAAPRDVCVFTYTPSLTIYAMLRARGSGEPESEFVGLAPGFDGASLADVSPGGSAGWRGLFGQLGPVVGGRDEVEHIRRLLGRRSHAVVDQRATEHALKARAGDCRYVHIATHGVFEAGDPLFATGLLLSPPLADEPTADEHLDDFLQTHEMFDLELQAEVVVLSACQTGLGRHIDGEGVLGMSRALLLAGARCVVASMWPVVNLITQDLMEAFYERLQADVPPAFALHQAKMRVRADHEDPSFWAGFVCIGDAG